MKSGNRRRAAATTIGMLAWMLVVGTSSGCSKPKPASSARVPAAVRAAREAPAVGLPKTGAPAAPDPALDAQRRILFGDLHVHTTISLDAFFMSLPIMGGVGAHPPDEACDFARFCSGLDFFAITDHAMATLPSDWKSIKESIRGCNALAGPAEDPDVVAFTGFEWTQHDPDPEHHFGHKNVIFEGTADDQLPRRPIEATSRDQRQAVKGQANTILLALLGDPGNAGTYFDFRHHLLDLSNVSFCPSGVDTRQLPDDCQEEAPDPPTLFEKLDQWGFDALVIPHGNAWGIHVPPHASWDLQARPGWHDPARQNLIEVYSGHGNSEEFRSWQEWDVVDGQNVCREPTKSYLPCCWQAGEIVRSRCADPRSTECDAQVLAAREAYIEGGVYGASSIPDAKPEEWLDCGQCRDCYLPDFNMRPRMTVQAALATTGFEDPANPVKFRFGLIASSDTHRAKPGTGYKDDRSAFTDASGAHDRMTQWVMDVGRRRNHGRGGVMDWELERQGSYWYTGGLVAVHAENRTREAIWQALKERRVYGTSGERMLLWFDLLGADGTRQPMGSEVTLGGAPRFEVRAVGAFKQKPGCPADTLAAAGQELIDRVCVGECYNPSDERQAVDRIEVVRIRPQARQGEPFEKLIEDPWKVIRCPADPAGCVVTFEDPDFVASGRTNVYYVRAVEPDTATVNGATLRCTWDEHGNCTKIEPCYSDYRTPQSDDCLAPAGERAWSSPIFVDFSPPKNPAVPAESQ